MESYLGVAEEMGITRKEIGAVQSVVMAVHAGRVNAQLTEVRLRRLSARAKAKRKS